MSGFTFQPKPEGNHYVTIHKCYKGITDGKESTAAVLSALEFLASRAFEKLVEKGHTIPPDSIEINGDCNSPLIAGLLDGMLKPTAIKQKFKVLKDLDFISYQIEGGKSRKVVYHYKAISKALNDWAKSDESLSDESKNADSRSLTRQKVTRQKVPQTIPIISTIPISSPIPTNPPTPHGGDALAKNQNPAEGKGKTWGEVLDEKEEELPQLNLKFTETEQPPAHHPKQQPTAEAKINSSALTTVQPSVDLRKKPVPATRSQSRQFRTDELRAAIVSLPDGRIPDCCQTEWRMNGWVVWEGVSRRLDRDFVAFVAKTVMPKGSNSIQRSEGHIRNWVRSVGDALKIIDAWEKFEPQMSLQRLDLGTVATDALEVAIAAGQVPRGTVMTPDIEQTLKDIAAAPSKVLKMSATRRLNALVNRQQIGA